LEQEEARLSEAGDPLGALILDAFGSAAAEEAAEMLHARVCAAVQHENLKAARRVSPGYGKWNVVRQADLLAHLPIEEVGIRLTQSSMMIPRKSVSFAVVLEPPGRVSTRGRCAVCDLTDCRYRRHDATASRAVEETKGHE
jgi:cobalamin-dependent methionine synthase I